MVDRVASPESGGLCPLQLSSNELDIILKIERHAKGIEDRPKHSKEAVWPIAQTRHERVILLDGDRGSGKTSLMWTLIERWNPNTFDSKKLQKRYEQRAKEAKKDGDSVQALGAPPENIRVLSMLDFDPLPPSMPVVAGMVQAWRPLAEELVKRLRTVRTQDLDDETVVDHWQNLFRTAAAGWGKLGERKTLIDQILDQEEQIGDWATLGAEWQKFITRIVAAGKLLPQDDPYRLSDETVFVIMIDDCDLQVERIQEILPAIRLLYDSNVLFIVSADRKHMLDMLELDYLGRQNFLSNRQIRENPFKQNDRWARALAEASFEKVFPTRHRLRLPRLPLSEVLRYPSASTVSSDEETFGSLFDDWSWDYESGDGTVDGRRLPNTPDHLSSYLTTMSDVIEDLQIRLPIATYRTIKQSWDRLQQEDDANERVRQAVARLIGGSDFDEVIGTVNPTTSDSPVRVMFNRLGLLTAEFDEQLSTPFAADSKIQLSASPEFRLHKGGEDVDTNTSARPLVSAADEARRSQSIIAISLRDDSYNVDAPSMGWEIRQAVAWTFHRRPQQMNFSWPRIYHPSPLRLMSWAHDWRAVVSRARKFAPQDRRWVIAHAYISHQLKWTIDDFELPEMDTVPVRSDIEALIKDTPVDWWERVWAQLARPEIGLPIELQDFILTDDRVKDRKAAIQQERRQGITDALIAGGQALLSDGKENSARVRRTEDWFEQHLDHEGRSESPWATHIGLDDSAPVKRP